MHVNCFILNKTSNYFSLKLKRLTLIRFLSFKIYLFSDPTLFYTINYGTLTRHIICSRSVSWLRRSTWFWHKKKNATKKEAKSMHTVRFSETIISDGVGRLTTSLVMWSCIFLLYGCERIDTKLYLLALLSTDKCVVNRNCCSRKVIVTDIYWFVTCYC